MSVPSSRDLLDLVAAFYDAGLGVGPWQDALNKLATVFGAISADLAIQGGTAGVVAVGVDDAAVESFIHHYATLNPVFPAIPRQPLGAPFTDVMVAPRDVTLRSEFYNDWARPNGLDQALAAVLMHNGNGLVNVCRSPREGDFESTDVELMALLVPYLQRAALAHTRLADAMNDCADAVAALDRLQLGVLLVTADAAVLYANPAAEAIVAEADGLRIDRGKLSAASTAQTASVRQLLKASASAINDPLAAPKVARSEAVLRLERPSGRRPLALIIVPLPPRTSAIWITAVRRTQAIVFVTDPERQIEPLPATLRRIYGLTTREASLAIEISRGDGLPAVAERLGIKSATARTHLLRVFAKTDTRRQADLTRLVESLGMVSQSSQTFES